MIIIKIIPIKGHIVPMPFPPYQPIPPDGVMVEYPGPQSYWVRRQQEGVVTVEKPAALKPEKKRGKK